MKNIQDLFDPSKKLNRTIESVVTFGANTEQDLSTEIHEYVVTNKLHDSYEGVITDLQAAFDNSSKEVGIWVSGFYGSGKSSFAKYLGLSFDKSLMIDGVSFGDRLMSRIQDSALTAMHKAIIARHNPQVVMIDLSTQSTAGKIATVSDIVYYETLKLLNITKSTDQKVMCFINLLHSEGKYDEFCQLVETEKHKQWESVESNDLAANLIAASLAPRVLTAYFPDSASFKEINLNSALNEKERFIHLCKLVKEKTGKDKIIFVLDEVGQYIASNTDLIHNLAGMMHILKDEFKGDVWVIATAQQTLTEDNPYAQLNSTFLFPLNDRFPIKVDIEANDIKEIIIKRLLGKSPEGYNYLKQLFVKNEGVLKNGVHLTIQERTIYNQVLTDELFANLYPFLPVHIDILLSLLQKLASRTGGVGLRSVIRLIRDILVDNHLADKTIGQMAGPEHFYDVLHSDMEKKNSFKEIVLAADKAIQVFTGNTLGVRICKTIAVMQLLDDFNLSFDNLCALLYNSVGGIVDKANVRDVLDEIMQTSGLTLQEIDGKYQFMTNAILGIRKDRDDYVPTDSEKSFELQECLKDILSPAPSVNVFSSKTITAGVELTRRNRSFFIHPTSSLKLNVRFTDGASFDEVHRFLLSESTRGENSRVMYWLCTLSRDDEPILRDIVRSTHIKQVNQNNPNKEIQAYLRAQTDNAEDKKRQLVQLLRDAMANSEIIFRGSPQQVNGETYKSVALKTIAEKVFEKYPLAATNMKTNCVTQISQYEDIRTIPKALNPFDIIKTAEGAIDTSHPTLSEVKDYISMRGDVTGADVVVHFERDPYGWSKDTIRYVVALMLKAGIIKIHSFGKDISVFGKAAVEALDTNNSFSKINITLNSDGALKTAELLKAAQNLTSLFNSGKIGLVKDAIAKEAFVRLNEHLISFQKLVESSEDLHLAGLATLRQAVSYAHKIVSSEGGEAPFLLGKDDGCIHALHYAMSLLRCDRQAKLFDHLRHINHLLDEALTLPKLPQLNEFMKNVSDVKQLYQDYIQNPDIQEIVSEVTDLQNQLDSYLVQACVHFQTEGNRQLTEKRNEITSSASYSHLSDSQRERIDSRLGDLSIEYTTTSFNGLRTMVNDFTSHQMTAIPGIVVEVNKLAEANVQPVSPDEKFVYGDKVIVTPPQEELQDPRPITNRITVRKRITTKADLQAIIDQLTRLLAFVNENSPIELKINE